MVTLPTMDTTVISSLCADVPGLRAVYRYGSTGGAHERADSDLDLAILADMPLDVVTRVGCAARLSCKTGRSVDLADMRRLPVTLRVQIVTQGTRLFASDPPTAEAYDSHVLSDYARLNEERQWILADIRERGSVYG